MTAPIPLPLPKDFYNRPPKELAGYSSTVVDDGDDIAAPSGPGGALDVIMPFHAVYGYPVEIVEQPAAGIAPADFVPEWYDATNATHARLVAHLETAGASGAVVQLQYAPNYPSAPTVFADAGTPSSVVLPINATGALKSPWVQLADTARTDVVWRPAFAGGDGIVTPVIGKLSAQFRVGTAVILDKWYLRTGAPTDPDGVGAQLVPADTPGVYDEVAADPFFAVDGADGNPLTTKNLPDASGLGILSLTKGNSGIGTSAGGERATTGDVEDYVCSWVGPSLAGGQVIPQSSVMMFYKEADSLFHSFAVWEIGIWRPAVGVVALWSNPYLRDFVNKRFVPLNKYEYAMGLVGDGLAATVDGDRWIVGLGLVVENTGSLCFGRVGYNGGYEPVPGLNTANDAASYLLIPRMRYLSLTA